MREILLGLIQGLTEFLPISSSGHLVIGQHLLPGTGDIEADVLLDILLHVATLFVVLLYYRQEILSVLSIALASVRRSQPRQNSTTGGGLDERVLQKMPLLILVGTIPTGVLGILIKLSDRVEAIFSSLALVGLALIVTGIVLYLADTRSPGSAKTELSYLDAFIIGTVQGIAILPGISRSGSTISTGILRGIERKTAATFSFLLSIPAILGVMVLEGKDILTLTQTPHVLPYILGMAAAFISGYIAIAALIRVVVRRKLRWFSFYCWIVGGIALIVGII